MMKDAEANAEEDRKQVELVHARNQCDHMVHTVKKSLSELGDKVDAAEKARIEEAIKAAEEALKTNDKDTIEAKTEALAKASQKIGEQMYAQAGAQAGAGGPQPGAAGGGGGQQGGKAEEDVVDAEFEEVKDKK
jgi:molecular chaperone DnaK